jgi:hypothetical protein
MLVALGEARIVVTHAEPHRDDGGAYTLLLDRPADATHVLSGIGCVVDESPS